MDELRARKRHEPNNKDLDNKPNLAMKKTQNSSSMNIKVLKVFLGLLLLLILYLATVSSPIDPKVIVYPDSLPRFKGVMEPNKKLQEAEHLFEGQLVGPESMIMDLKGNIYTGLADGRIVRITKDGQLENVTRTGENLAECGSYETEPRCGRPLGMRLNSEGNRLIVCDVYKGLLSVEISTGAIETIIHGEVGIEGRPFKFLNDLTISSDGIIYFTDSSWKWSRRDARYLVIEGDAHGRLMYYNQNTKERGVLLSGLYFPNGIELSHDESHLVLCESTIARIIRFHLKGEHKGTHDLFNANFPGLPDKIRRRSGSGYWVGSIAIRKWPFSLLDFLAPYPAIRSTLTKILSQETLAKIVPKYGLMVHMDDYGDIISSYHDPSGKIIPSVSEILQDPKNNILYLGSYHAPFFARLKL